MAGGFPQGATVGGVTSSGLSSVGSATARSRGAGPRRGVVGQTTGDDQTFVVIRHISMGTTAFS